MPEAERSRYRCTRCETLPGKLVGPGRLYLWLPRDHTLAKTYKHLRNGGWDCETGKDQALVIHTKERSLSDLTSYVSEAVTDRELTDTRALFKIGGDELSVGDIPRVQSLSQLSALDRSEWLLDMLSEDRLTTHFQPIVRTADPTEIYGQECLLRGIDAEDRLVTPGKIFEAARDTGMLFQTDLAARRTAIRQGVRHEVTSNLFVNFTPTSIYDPRFCLRPTIEAIDEAGLRRDRVVFEITETENVRDTNHLKNIVDFYRETGFRVALDDVGSGYSSLNMIHVLRPDFIKLDMQLIRDVHDDPYKATVAGKVLEMAESLGVETIVEGVEHRGELDWARDKGASYAQGHLIAKPSTPPLQDHLNISHA